MARVQGEYLWNHSNGSMLTDFFVNEFIGGDQGMGSPYVDGFFIGVTCPTTTTLLVSPAGFERRRHSLWQMTTGVQLGRLKRTRAPCRSVVCPLQMSLQ